MSLRNWLEFINKSLNWFFLLLVHFYQSFLSGFTGGSCRFYPSCSQYAVEALKSHVWWKAIYLIAQRILKCRPYGPYGMDPLCKDSKCGMGSASRNVGI